MPWSRIEAEAIPRLRAISTLREVAAVTGMSRLILDALIEAGLID